MHSKLLSGVAVVALHALTAMAVAVAVPVAIAPAAHAQEASGLRHQGTDAGHGHRRVFEPKRRARHRALRPDAQQAFERRARLHVIEAALSTLLRGTGLTARATGAGTYTVTMAVGMATNAVAVVPEQAEQRGGP
jgi:hypothetical protein